MLGAEQGGPAEDAALDEKGKDEQGRDQQQRGAVVGQAQAEEGGQDVGQG